MTNFSNLDNKGIYASSGTIGCWVLGCRCQPVQYVRFQDGTHVYFCRDHGSDYLLHVAQQADKLAPNKLSVTTATL